MTRLLSTVYRTLLQYGLPSRVERLLRSRGHLTVQVVKDEGAYSRPLIRMILASRASVACVAVVQTIEEDKTQTVARLGTMPANPDPLPRTSFATEAEALVGCATPAEGGRLLFSTVHALKPRSVVEIGTAHGYGALYVGSALRNNGMGKLWTLEGMSVRVRLSRDAVRRFELTPQVEVVDGDFAETLPDTLAVASPLDMLFADGDKEPETTRRQFAMAMAAMSDGGHMFYDDIDFSPEILAIWTDIVNHPRVQACVIFNGRWGLLKVAPGATRKDSR